MKREEPELAGAAFLIALVIVAIAISLRVLWGGL